MMSKLEKKVYRILTKNNIDFIQEKVFTDLRNGKYRFDFYIPYLPSGKIAIEVNGLQHYKYSKFFHKNRSEFTKAKERDRQKIGYCLAHNIKLYCIPYWDIDTIKKLDDLFRDKYLALTKYHNDEVWRLKILEDNA